MEPEKKDLFPLFKPEPPFMELKGGFGYLGVIMQSMSQSKIQCHFCGKLFKNVGKHAWWAHGMSNDQYREKTGLNKGTPLVCESTSRKMRENFNQLSDGEKEKRIKVLRENSKKVHKEKLLTPRSDKGSIQYKNSKGTCDLQAKSLFWEEYNKLGRIPLNGEMSAKLKGLVYTRFHSINDALRSWGISENEVKEKDKETQNKAYDARKNKEFFPKYKIETVINSVKYFKEKNGRLPSWKEAEREGLPSRIVFKRLFGTHIKKELEKIFK